MWAPQDLADATAAGLGNSANADLLSLLRNRITPVSSCSDNRFCKKCCDVCHGGGLGLADY